MFNRKLKKEVETLTRSLNNANRVIRRLSDDKIMLSNKIGALEIDFKTLVDYLQVEFISTPATYKAASKILT